MMADMMAELEFGVEDFIDYINRVNENENVIVLQNWLPKRYIRDTTNPMEVFQEKEFKKRFRFSKDTINRILLLLVIPDLQKVDNRGLPIPPVIQLLVALRFYATSSFQIVCADLRSVSQFTVSRIIVKVSTILCRSLHNYVAFPSTATNFNSIKRQFYEIAQLPGIIGCIDGVHILIENPGGEHSEVFRNRKGRFFINVQCVVDPTLQIMDIVARRSGSTHDSRIFDNFSLRVRFEEGRLRGILLGDAGYRCTAYLLTPINNMQTEAEERYNIAHRRTRQVVERTFGCWKRRFACLRKGLATSLPTTIKIICAAAILHNISIQVQDNVENDEEDNDDIDYNEDDHIGEANNAGFVARVNYIERYCT